MKQMVVSALFAAVLGLVARPATAQEARKFLRPACELNTGHFLVNGAVTYLQGATEEADTAKAERMLSDAMRNLQEALVQGEVENPAVWYYLGRAYELANDVVGADSAYGRAEELQPDCAEDIAYHRQLIWVPLINAAIDSLRAGAFEAGKDLLRSANIINDRDNAGFYYLARIFGAEGEIDSAIHYSRRVAEIGITDSARAENYYTTLLNTGRLFSMAAETEDSPELWDSAAAWFQKYRTIDSANSEALLGLAEAYAGAGKQDLAMVMYDSVLARSGEMTAEDLFSVGETVFLADRFDVAVRAYKLGLEKNPYSRLGLFNLANSYLALADEAPTAAQRREIAKEMQKYAQRLIEIDPLNTESLRILAAAFQLQGASDSADAMLRRVDTMDYELWVDMFEPSNGGAIFQARVVNLRDREVQVPQITCEFLDATGKVVAAGSIEPVTLAVTRSHSFAFNPPGENVVAWRCRTGQ